jgi:hypothetical protein
MTPPRVSLNRGIVAAAAATIPRFTPPGGGH